MATIVDSYSETNQDGETSILNTHPTAGDNASARGQSFTGDGQKISSCKFYMKKAGSPGNMIARLYAHTGTFGTSSVPTGAALDSSSQYAASTVLGASLALFEFTGWTGYTMVNATKYCIVVESVDGTWDADNGATFGWDGSSPSHGGNLIYYVQSAWGAYADGDCCFYVYGTPVGWANISHDKGVAASAMSHKKGIAVADISHVKGIEV